MFRVIFFGLLSAMLVTGAGAAPPSSATRPQLLPPAGATNRPAASVGFSTRRLVSSSAEEATLREIFRGAVRLLPDDRTEITYDFTQPSQLEDFALRPGEGAPGFVNGPWEVRDGFLQKLALDDVPIFHRARFVGPVTVSFKGYLLKGNQYVAGYLQTQNNNQLHAAVGGQPLVMSLGENSKVLADAPKSPLTGKVQDLLVNFDAATFSIGPVGWRPLVAQRTPGGGELGQVFWAAPGSSVALDDLKVTGRLDLDWFRNTMDARLTKEFVGRASPRYGPPPCTETQLRQMIKGFRRLLPNGQVELHYDFNEPAHMADWQVIDAHGRADPFAWRLANGAVRKCQFGPTWFVLQPLLVGPMKISGRAAIVSGSRAALGLRDAEANLLCGFQLGDTGWFLADGAGRGQTAPARGMLLGQFHTLELTRDDDKVNAKLDSTLAQSGTTKRSEPLNVVLSSEDSTAAFSNVHVVAFLDYDWCVRQLKLYGFQQASLPGAFAANRKSPADPGSASRAVNFASSSKMKVQSNADWQDTAITLRKGDTVNISASGSYQYERSAKSTSGPEGMPGTHTKTRPPCASLAPCALVGRIGFGEPFEVGGSKRFVAAEMGNLFLRVNEQPVYDNTGALDVEIVILPAAK